MAASLREACVGFLGPPAARHLTRKIVQGAIMGVPNRRKLRTQLIALIRRGRTFAHQGTPLTWIEVDRLVALGRRCLEGVYGDNSPKEADYLYQTERAFHPMYTSAKERGRVNKAGWNRFYIDAGDMTDTPPGVPAPALAELRLEDENFPKDLVLRVNKIHLRNALQVLLEAVHRCQKGAHDRAEKPDEPASAMARREARAATVAKILDELNTLKQQLFDDSEEYDLLEARYPEFLCFQIAKDRPDLKMKLQGIQGSPHHLRLAKELAAARFGKSLATIEDDWKDHKPADRRRR